MSGTTNKTVGRLVDLIMELDLVQEVGEELARRCAACEGWGAHGQGVDRETLRAELRDVLEDALGRGGLSQGSGMMEWLSVKEAAERVGVSPRTVRGWVKKGHLRTHGPAGASRIRADDLGAFMEGKSKGMGKVLSIKGRAREILERTSRRDD